MVWSGVEGVEATEQPGIDSRLYNALDWNGIVECVLQGERSLLMQFSMHESDSGVLFLIEF